jgi:hypothetical protein
MIVNQRYDFERLIDRQQYWRNEFRRDLGQAVADARGLIYAHFDVKGDYVTGKSSIPGAISLPIHQLRIFSVCFDPADREHQHPISIEWPPEFLACYHAHNAWVREGGAKPAIPTLPQQAAMKSEAAAQTITPPQSVREAAIPSNPPMGRVRAR